MHGEEGLDAGLGNTIFEMAVARHEERATGGIWIRAGNEGVGSGIS